MGKKKPKPGKKKDTQIVDLGTFSGSTTNYGSVGTLTGASTIVLADNKLPITTIVLGVSNPPERRSDLWDALQEQEKGTMMTPECWDAICDLVEQEVREERETAYAEGCSDGAYEEAMSQELRCSD